MNNSLRIILIGSGVLFGTTYFLKNFKPELPKKSKIYELVEKSELPKKSKIYEELVEKSELPKKSKIYEELLEKSKNSELFQKYELSKKSKINNQKQYDINKYIEVFKSLPQDNNPWI